MTNQLTGRFFSQFSCICITWLEWLLLHWKSSTDALSENLPQGSCLHCTSYNILHTALHFIIRFTNAIFLYPDNWFPRFRYLNWTNIHVNQKSNRAFLQRKSFVVGEREALFNKVCFSPNWNHQCSEEHQPKHWTLCFFISNRFF